ncbi:MAG: T9SS type A sorting domain-containing protein [Rhodothermia bacterium]|nr:T9SS type A sorting domain-containing protein [Rhodothermia bacterium]
MKKILLLLLLLPVTLLAQPVVDGQGGDPCYKSQGTFSGSNGTFGDWGVKEVQACTHSQTLYIFLKGAVNPTGYHDILVFINATDKTGGIPAGAAGEIPAGNDGLSPFNKYAFPLSNPIETDYGVRLTADAANLKGYVSHINYLTGNTDAYLGEVTYGGTAVTYSGMTFAHVQAASMSAATGGFELALPYSLWGSGVGAQFQLYVVYGNENGNVYSVASGTIQTPLFSGTATATERDEVPTTATLEVYPNPFNPEATTRFSVPQTQTVQVALYNALGQKLKTLYTGTAVAGQNIEARISGNNLQSGVYYLKLTGNSVSQTRVVSLIK